MKDEPTTGNGGQESARRKRQKQQGSVSTVTTQRAAAQGDNDDDEDRTDGHVNRYLDVTGAGLNGMKISDISLSNDQMVKWNRVSDSAKVQIVKAVTRLLLLRGE